MALALVPRRSVLGLVRASLAGEPRGDHGLAELARGPESRRSTAAIAAVAALHKPALAPTALAEPRTPRQAHALALLVRERGAPSAARDIAARSGQRRFEELVGGELALLAGEVSAASASHARGHRVVHVVTNALPEVTAGYTTRTHGIASAQAELGPVTVTTRLGFPAADGKVRAPSQVHLDGVTYQRLLPRRGRSRTVVDAAREEAQAVADLAEDARVLHAHSHHVNGTIAGAAAVAVGLPWIYEVRGFLEETWIARGGDPTTEFVTRSRDAETRVMHAAHHVVTLSEGMRAEVVSRGVDPARVSVIPNAVSSAWLEPHNIHDLRERLALPRDALLVGSVSTLNDYEGLDLLAPIVAGLRKAGLKAHGVIVGDGAARASLQTQAADGSVTFVGKVPPSLARQYHAALDVFVVPRVDSSVTRMVTPLKPLEAMATGSLVISSDLAPLREVTPPESGALIVERDAQAWVDAIVSTASAGEIAERGARGREWVANNRTWEAAARAYSAVYAAVEERPVH